MPYSKKFNKLKRVTIKEYGKKKGTSIAFALARKRHWRIHKKGGRYI